jgi:hypothetical protein
VSGTRKRNPVLVARNDRVLDAWIAGVHTKVIAAQFRMEPENVLVVVHKARAAGDPRAVLRRSYPNGWRPRR